MRPQPSPHASPAIPAERIHPDALKVIRRLVSHGFKAYLVGGCVRDLLLDRHPKDFDLATDARPRQVKRLFRNSRIIGRRFRLVHVHFGGHVLEVATFRAPPTAQDGDDPYIHRDNVFGTEVEDAFRRDFTINGLFYDVSAGRLIDHVDGLADLERALVRTIGDPEVRIREDPVRILRAAKFAGRLGFELDAPLREAARRHAGDLQKSAAPRVLEEFYRLLCNRGAPEAFRLLDELGALRALVPELTPLPPDFPEILTRLEEWTQGSRDAVPQSILVSVLFWPMALPVLLDRAPPDLEAALQDALHPMGQRLIVARRDFTLARQILALQPRFSQFPQGRSDRRVAHREYFPLAIRLREILGPLPGADAGALDAWKAALRQKHGPHAEGDRGSPRRRRRRRRGGRRRRSRGGGKGAGA